ncbi:MAG: hypothetical protein DI586_08265, partial [Micavibrio aeruginosavorus]
MRFFILICLLITAHPSFAADRKESLQQIEERVAAEKEKQNEIDSKMKDLEKGMKGLKTDLIKTTSLVQKNESESEKLEEKLENLDLRKKNLTDNLTKDRASLAELVTALERIRRLPPEALIARPGAPLQTAQASIVLGAIMPELNSRAEAVKAKLDAIREVEEDIASNKDKLKLSAEKLKENKERMEALMAARQDTIKQTKSEYAEQEKQVATLSRKASDLKDLIAKIEEQRQLAEEKRRLQKKLSSSEQKLEGKKRKSKVDENMLGGTLASLGNARLPSSGAITIKYGQEDDLGAASEGLHIRSRPGSVVIAPLKGVVRYAG